MEIQSVAVKCQIKIQTRDPCKHSKKIYYLKLKYKCLKIKFNEMTFHINK